MSYQWPPETVQYEAVTEEERTSVLSAFYAGLPHNGYVVSLAWPDRVRKVVGSGAVPPPYPAALVELDTRLDTLEAGIASVYQPGGTDVPVGDGGTGASSAAVARTNLGAAAASDLARVDPGVAGTAGQYLSHDGTTPIFVTPPIIDASHPRWGLAGDGVTDDAAALTALLAFAATLPSSVIQLGRATYRLVCTATNQFVIPANTTLRGVSRNATTLLLETDGLVAEWRYAIREGGDNATISHLTIQRGADFSVVHVRFDAHDNFVLDHVRINGRRDLYPSACHGVQIGTSNTGVSSNSVIRNSHITRCNFGLLQDSASLATIRGFTVQDSRFDVNYRDDLQFNSPNGTTTDVVVINTIHRDNQYTGTGAGFAVGLAHVTGAMITNVRAYSYSSSAVHIEDYSTDVTVAHCRFEECGLRMATIDIMGGSDRIHITDNLFRKSVIATTNGKYFVNVSDPEVGTTVGGRPSITPKMVSIEGNTIIASAANLSGIYVSKSAMAIVSRNRVLGQGTGPSAASSTYTGSDVGMMGISVEGGESAVVTDNIVKGFRNGIGSTTHGNITFGRGAVVSGNNVSLAETGIRGLSVGECTIADNMIRNCVYPLLVAEGHNAPSYPAVVSGNHAYDCTNAMEVYGTTQVFPTAAVTVGTGRTVGILAARAKIPVGTAITFTGGRVFTLTVQVNFGAVSMTGDLTGADLAAYNAGTATISHSYTAANNYRAVFGNGDFKHGAIGYPYKTRVNGDWTAS